jgi:hypothetical protein
VPPRFGVRGIEAGSNQFTLGSGKSLVDDDTLAKIGFGVWLYGWVIAWPLARYGMRRTSQQCRLLLWILVIGVVLEVASFIYLWDLHRAGNRDWFMAWLFPQATASIAWVASFIAFIFVAVSGAPAKSSA